MDSKKNDAPFMCSLCDMDFRNHRSFMEHVENNHPIEKMKNSDVQNVKGMFNESDKHLDFVEKKRYHYLRKISPKKTEENITQDKLLNDQCFSKRWKNAQFDELLRNNEQLECDSCKKRFQRREGLIEHKESCGFRNIFKVKEKYIECASCHRKYRYRRGVLEHIRRHHPWQVSPRANQVSRKCNECDFCHRKYSYRRGVLEHIKLYHPSQVTPKLFKIYQNANECVICHRRYSYKRGLYEHVRNFHPALAPQKIRNYGCDLCNKKYSYMRGLREHIRNHHVGVIAKKCKNPSKLKKCEFCNKVYNFNHALYEHVKREHPQYTDKYSSTEKIFTCFLCNTSYAHRSGIISHLQKHHPTTISTENDPERTFACNSCHKKFKLESSLTLHMRREHAENLVMCAFCGEMLLSREKLTCHIQKHHCVVEKEKDISNRSKQRICVCPLCSTSYIRKCDIFYHLYNSHGIQIKEKFYEYDNEEAFLDWKEQVEHSTRSKFVLYNKHKSDSEIVVNYVCNRSEWYQTRSRGIRNIRVGTKKINSYCPAEIQLRICNEQQSYSVHFISTHVGHDANELSELRYRKLPKSESECSMRVVPVDELSSDIDDITWYKLSDNINYTSALDEEFAAIATDNICDTKDFEILTFIQEYSDATCVESWIDNNRADVLYYKGKNQDDPAFSKLDTNDFVLIIANEYQMEMLRNFGTNIIAIDGTHEPNVCDFELSIVTVFDNLMQEFPSVFMFSNRRDQYVCRILFRKIMEKIGKIETTVFISDLNENYRKSWGNIMPSPKISLYCSWHVSQEWKKKLNKIALPEKRNDMKVKLEAMRTELNPYRFHELLQNLVDDNDPDTREFRNYFEKYFLGDVSAWAYCYRKHAQVNTITEVENFFAFSEKSRGGNETTLDLSGGLNVLSELLQNLYSDKIKIEVDAKLVPKSKALRMKHIEAVKNISKMKFINKLTENKWYVPSFIDEDNVHDIELVVTYCECELRCAMCNACLHQYVCSCAENCIEYNMCEHIHLVCLLENESKHKIADDILEDAENLIEVIGEQ